MMTFADIYHLVSEVAPPETFRRRFRCTNLVTDAQINSAMSSAISAYVLPSLTAASSTEVDKDTLGLAAGYLCYAVLLTRTSEVTRYAVARPNKNEAAPATAGEITREVRHYRAMGLSLLRSIAEACELDMSSVTFSKILDDEL